jgi:hypothetical protein
MDGTGRPSTAGSRSARKSPRPIWPSSRWRASFDHLQPARRRRRGPADVLPKSRKAAKKAGLEAATCRSCPARFRTRMPSRFGEALSDLPGRCSPIAAPAPARPPSGRWRSGRAGHAAARHSRLPPRQPATTCRAWSAASPMAARRPPMSATSRMTSSSSAAAGGISVASSLLARASESLDIAIIDPQTCITTSRAGRWSAAAFSNREHRQAPWLRSFPGVHLDQGRRVGLRTKTMRSSSMAAGW